MNERPSPVPGYPTPAGCTTTREVFWFGPASGAASAVGESTLTPLLGVSYGGAPAAPPFPCIAVPNELLAGAPALELWRTEGPGERRRRGAIEIAWGGDLLVAAARWPLAGRVEDDTRALYRELLAIADSGGYPGLLRLWNYLPGINDDQDGIERYRRFNAGRAAAFVDRFGAAAERRFCASSAVGAPGDELVTVLLATREEGRHLENPRQLPAWRYPPIYGQVSPSFARATLAPAACGLLAHGLLVSGTASIVGHESRHDGDVLAQLHETIANLRAILQHAGSRLVDLDFVKVYLRHPGDLPRVREHLLPHLRPDASVLWLQAEICRAELLLEIEGMAF